MEKKRRKFIKDIGLTGAALALAPMTFGNTDRPKVNMFRQSNPSNGKTLKIGLVGAGGMGVADTITALNHENTELVAVCDLYKGRLDKAQERWGNHLFLTADYKALLKRKDIDVVIIGTTDHWHKQISVDALNAGKHVYCEKPMVHSVKEGHDLINAWKKSGRIFMVGSQGLSSLGNEKAKQLLADGAIGTLNYAEGFWARNSPEGAWQYGIPKDGSKETVDWERYISNTTKRPFDALRFFRWRNYLDYGTGMSGDLFVHLFSSLHFVTNSKGPNKISATGGLRHWKDGREVPDVLLGMFDYPDTPEHPAFNLSLRCNFVDGTSGSTYLKLVGSKGSMDVKWEEVVLKRNTVPVMGDDPFMSEKMNEVTQRIDRKRMLPPLETVFSAERGYKGAHYDHFANFFAAIRNNGDVVEDAVFGFRAAAPALLCNDSYRKNAFIGWDPIKMQIV